MRLDKKEIKLNNLLKHIEGNALICPMPSLWNKLYDLILNKKSVHNGDSDNIPSPPLILGAWQESDASKAERFKEHIHFAYENNELEEVEEFIMDLKYDDWLRN